MSIDGKGEPEIVVENPDGSGFGGYYGLTVDPSNSEIYVSDAIDFVQRGMVYRFSPAGEPVDTFRAGIVPSSFCFKPARSR